MPASDGSSQSTRPVDSGGARGRCAADGGSMGISVNGIAHVQLTVRDPARSLPFWERLCHFLGLQTLIKGDEVLYCIGGRTGILVRGAPAGKRDTCFDQDRAGL